MSRTPARAPAPAPVLSDAEVDAFIDDGFVRLDEAFPRALADECRAILWPLTGCDPDEPATWTRPVVRIGYRGDPPFRAAVDTARLHAALDRLVGAGRWIGRSDLGTFPVRFPVPGDPGDAGWHVDASFGWQERPDDFMSWRVNVASKDRALLMLFLLSDVGDDDAPTRIRARSHRVIARRLAPAGEAGLSLRELSADGYAAMAELPEVAATGAAGTVYLCHPFLVHAAQPHRGTRPRFIAQPPLHPALPLQLERRDGDYSPVEESIRRALGRS